MIMTVYKPKAKQDLVMIISRKKNDFEDALAAALMDGYVIPQHESMLYDYKTSHYKILVIKGTYGKRYI